MNLLGAQAAPHFNGSDYDPKVDDARLGKQHERIRTLMVDGAWRTLHEIAACTGDPPASISAQLRHLRKKRFGSWVVDKRPRGDRAEGLWEYQLLPAGSEPEHDTRAKKSVRRAREIDDLKARILVLEADNARLRAQIAGTRLVGAAEPLATLHPTLNL